MRFLYSTASPSSGKNNGVLQPGILHGRRYCVSKRPPPYPPYPPMPTAVAWPFIDKNAITRTHERGNTHTQTHTRSHTKALRVGDGETITMETNVMSPTIHHRCPSPQYEPPPTTTTSPSLLLPVYSFFLVLPHPQHHPFSPNAPSLLFLAAHPSIFCSTSPLPHYIVLITLLPCAR